MQGAIIRYIECFIKTKILKYSTKFHFSVGYLYNALFSFDSFVFSKLNKIFVYFSAAIYPCATWKKLFC